MEYTAETKQLKNDSSFNEFDNSCLEILQDISNQKFDFDGYQATINWLSEIFGFLYRRENVK